MFDDFDLTRRYHPFEDEDLEPMNDEERKKLGCLGMILQFVLIVVLLTFLSLLASCTSHKTMTKGSHTEADTTGTEVLVITTNKVSQNDTANIVARDTTYQASSFTQHEDVDEVVMEHIVETTDTVGNKTVTTDRTIKRKRTNDVERTEQSGGCVNVDATSVSTMEADSTSVRDSAYQESHVAVCDTTYAETERDAVVQSVRSGLSMLWHVACLSIVAVLVIVGYRNKKDK